jgi:hypothetical protein
VATVYLETSFISACVTTRSDPGSLYRKQVSVEWWRAQAPLHDLLISQEVIAELSNNRYPHRHAALAFVSRIPLLATTSCGTSAASA